MPAGVVWDTGAVPPPDPAPPQPSRPPAAIRSESESTQTQRAARLRANRTTGRVIKESRPRPPARTFEGDGIEADWLEAVVTVTSIVAAAPDARESEVGDKVHAAYSGAPEQLRLTVPVKPAAAATDSV